MNNERRKQIEAAKAQLVEAGRVLEEARDAEHEYYDNMPESMQNGDKGQRAEEAATALEQAVDYIDSAITECETALEQ